MISSSHLFAPYIGLDLINSTNIVERYTVRYSATGQERLRAARLAQEINLHRWQLVQHNLIKSEWEALRTITTDDSLEDDRQYEIHNEWDAFMGRRTTQS